MKFDVIRFCRCLARGRHDWVNSKSKKGKLTCQRCGIRKGH